MIDIKEIYWAAGFMEGEGSFTTQIKRHGTNVTYRVTAPQKIREPLDRMQRLFGGTIGLEQGKIFRWKVVGTKAAGIMFTLYPLMSARRKEQILAVLNVWKNRPTASKNRHHCPKGHILGIYVKGKARECRFCKSEKRRKRYLRERTIRKRDDQTLVLI